MGEKLSDKVTEILKLVAKYNADNYIKLDKGFHMMTKDAMHQIMPMIDQFEDLCYIHGEIGDFWVGNWVYGMGMMCVSFPKSSCRDLTEKEFNQYNDSGMSINSTKIANLIIERRDDQTIIE